MNKPVNAEALDQWMESIESAVAYLGNDTVSDHIADARAARLKMFDPQVPTDGFGEPPNAYDLSKGPKKT